MPIGTPTNGRATATPRNVDYRIGRIAKYLSGRWLDYGCAEGGYTPALLESGADQVVGVDVLEDRVADARKAGIPNTEFKVFDGFQLNFADSSFDGAFMNEVFEHVADEQTTLKELFRVLCPGGYLVLISPNRWFPIEGHPVRIMGKSSTKPMFGIPWLPERLTRPYTEARNYWPGQLTRQVADAGFAILDVEFIWPVLEQYPWLPPRMMEVYQRHFRRWDHTIGLRRFGVSTMVVGVKPASVGLPSA
jgi:SAM-dependent methyltransferase